MNYLLNLSIIPSVAVLISRRRFRQKEEKVKKIASQRIENLYQLADEIMSKDYALAQKYAKLARNIALRLKIKIPLKYKKRTCIHCKHFLKAPINCRVRIRSRPKPHITVFCHNCRRFMRKYLKVSKAPNLDYEKKKI